MTGGIIGTFTEWHYDKLGLLLLAKRRWHITFFYKIVTCLLPDYLYSYLDFPSQENYLMKCIIRKP